MMSLYEMECEQCKLEPKVEGRIKILGDPPSEESPSVTVIKIWLISTLRSVSARLTRRQRTPSPCAPLGFLVWR
jgi:hypothetical protein